GRCTVTNEIAAARLHEIRNMIILLGTFGISFFACAVLTPVVRRLAVHYDLIDRPDGGRKAHSKPTPVAGGIAIFLAVILAAGGGLLAGNPLPDGELRQLIGLLLASVTICATGVADDRGMLRGRHKLAGQLVAVAILMGFGLLVKNIRLF